jgi:hypothetical protein
MIVPIIFEYNCVRHTERNNNLLCQMCVILLLLKFVPVDLPSAKHISHNLEMYCLLRKQTQGKIYQMDL